MAIRCANLEVFTAKGLKMLGQGGWATRPAACMLWLLVGILSIMVLTAAVHDYHLRKRLCLWHDEQLLVNGPDDAECWLIAISRDILTTFVLDILGVVKNAEKLKIKFFTFFIIFMSFAPAYEFANA